MKVGKMDDQVMYREYLLCSAADIFYSLRWRIGATVEKIFFEDLRKNIYNISAKKCLNVTRIMSYIFRKAMELWVYEQI